MNLIQEAINKIVGFIIRPTRQTYCESELGKNIFSVEEKIYQRTDFDVPYYSHSEKFGKSQSKMIIKASIFQRNKSTNRKKRNCILFLHGNIGNRLSSYSNIETALKFDLDIACFDFLGCGNSDGEYISLGHEEKYQIETVISRIHQEFRIDKFILWGRSMGAASAVLYCSHFNCKYVTGLILDSPYCKLEEMFKYIAKKKICIIPNFIIEKVCEEVDEKMNQEIGYSIKDLNLLQNIEKVRLPTYILYGIQDDIIDKQQIISLFSSIKGNKKFQMIEEQGHNERRDDREQESALKWILDFQN